MRLSTMWCVLVPALCAACDMEAPEPYEGDLEETLAALELEPEPTCLEPGADLSVPHEDLLAEPDGAKPWLASGTLAVTLDGRHVLVPDAEHDQLVVVDARTLEREDAVDVCSHPEHLLVLPTGEVTVSCRGDRAVGVVDVEERQLVRTIDVGAEPRGMAMTPDGATLYVASSASADVRAVAWPSAAPLWRAAVTAQPTALAVRADGSGLVVTHLLDDAVTELDPVSGAVSHVWRLGADPGRVSSQAQTALPLADGRVIVPHVMAAVGEPEPEVVERRVPSTYGGMTTETDMRFPQIVSGALTVISADAAETYAVIGSGYRRMANMGLQGPTSLVASAVHPRTGQVVLVDQSASFVNVLDGALRPPTPPTPPESEPQPRSKARGAEDVPPVQRIPALTLPVQSGPGGVAYSADGENLYVVSWIRRSVARYDARAETSDALVSSLRRLRSYGAGRLDPELVRGQELFHTLTPMTSRLGVACASCHPDGRQDGRVWTQSFGPRQTPQLAERLDGTGPFNWLGSEDTLEHNLQRTIERLAGTGLDDADAGALIAYMTRELVAPEAPTEDRDAALVAAGRVVFERDDVGCSGCHEGEALTDGLSHEVGTTSALEERLFRAQRRLRREGAPDLVPSPKVAYDTPSLADLHATAPYLHDGSAATLRDVITRNAAHDGMGQTSHLTSAEVDALVAYLETL